MSTLGFWSRLLSLSRPGAPVCCDHGSAPKITGAGHPTQQALTPGRRRRLLFPLARHAYKKHIHDKFQQQVHNSLLISARRMCFFTCWYFLLRTQAHPRTAKWAVKKVECVTLEPRSASLFSNHSSEMDSGFFISCQRSAAFNNADAPRTGNVRLSNMLHKL